MAGLITHQRWQLIEDRSGKETTFDVDTFGDSRYLEEKLVSSTGHDDK